MNVWFTADTHFFHRNIIKYCQRPYSDPEDMNNDILQKWNQLVDKDDIVYHLGDVSFGGQAETFELLAKLHGRLRLLCGNHDDFICENPFFLERLEWIKPYHEEKIEGHLIVMMHYPILEWRNAKDGAWHLHGHCHGCRNLAGKALDVGIDAHPEKSLWSWQAIQRYMSAKT